MIGRYAKLNVYQEIFKSSDFYRVAGGAFLIPVALLTGMVSNTGLVASLSLRDLVLIVSVALNGLPIIVDAVKGAMAREVNVDELVSIAIIACMLTGNYLEAAVVSAIMVVGALIEEAVSDSARHAIEELVEMTPATATLSRDGGEVQVKVDSIRAGDLLVVRSGETIAVDGVIRQGATSVDEAAITGESIPVSRRQGDEVFAGTTCVDGFITVEAVRVGEDSTFGKIVQMIQAAESSKTRSARIVDEYAKWFTPVILASAVLALLVTGEISRAITVLIVGCPCSFLLAGPVTTVAAISRAAKEGVLVKGGGFLETMAGADALYFDKTGTLTKGEPAVVEILPEGDRRPEDLLSMAAALETGSAHPLAHAILAKANALGCSVPVAREIQSEVGRGVFGRVGDARVDVVSSDARGETGLTTVEVRVDGELWGYLGMDDEARPEAREVIRAVEAKGLTDVRILSGDRGPAVRRLADQVGISRWHAGCKPHEKLGLIDAREGSGLIFVGDGVNDAPALKAADTGIAMGLRGSDVALETADIVLMNDRLETLPFLVDLSRRMSRTIKANIALSFGINLVAVLLGFAGVLTPILGAVAHNIGSILVVGLAASLRYAK
ncbi:heavy metal translocating P-type ATPase [Desulfoluna spongiiphila]|uniref:P-type Zn(2+) transporter n=1 Tax=Desulfoluna spongiiphila TaxID=419481 RepID=A0A1G5F6Z3_9BACT|nr:heavy metal translocating P-type ATPase [Desulfoluna spongiiphila]SCY34977.1 Cd2+/Zn2+-exporting ATPase [Desulfoluna spongiiphila]